MKKRNQYKKLCAMLKEKALANLNRLYEKAGAKTEDEAYKTCFERVEQFTNPDNMAAFCERENLSFKRLTALILICPFLITAQDAFYILKELDGGK